MVSLSSLNLVRYCSSTNQVSVRQFMIGFGWMGSQKAIFIKDIDVLNKSALLWGKEGIFLFPYVPFLAQIISG